MDGHWNAEVVRGKKAADTPGAVFSLDLKTTDGVVSGTVSIAGKKRPEFEKLQNVKLDGVHLTFITTQSGKNPATFSWEITLQGDQLVGSRTRQGTARVQNFTAKRN